MVMKEFQPESHVYGVTNVIESHTHIHPAHTYACAWTKTLHHLWTNRVFIIPENICKQGKCWHSFVRFISIFRQRIKVIRWNTFTKNFLFLCTQNFAHKLVGKPFHEVFLLWVLYDSTSNELTFCKANFTKSWWRLSLNLSVSDGFPKRIPEGMNQKLFGEMYKVLDK